LERAKTLKKIDEAQSDSQGQTGTPLYKLDVKKKMKVKVDLRKNKKEEFR
jgi:hypothetical protein